MSGSSRRAFLGGSALVALGTLGLSGASPVQGGAASAHDPYRVVSDSSEQWQALRRGTNLRWVGSPRRIAFPRTTAQVVAEVRAVLAAGLRPAVRSGGHCYEDFVSNDQVTAVIDLSRFDGVRWDPERGAFEVGAGVRLGSLYEQLYEQWGVYVPGGNCPTVGAGGHVAGGGYGSMNRRDGLIVDHLHAVEVVHVTADGSVRVAVGTRDPDDPHHDLWWAHTGGGGGNFGIATRYWFRSPGAEGRAPERALPSPPRSVWLSSVSWDWSGLDEAGFARLLSNHGRWHEACSAAGTAEAGLFSQLKTWHRSQGSVVADTVVDAAVPDALGVLDRYVEALADGVGRPAVREHRHVPWLQATRWTGLTGPDPTRRFDGKSAYLTRSYTDEAVHAAYRALVDPAFDNPGALLMIASYGGATNTVAPSATAVAQRSSVIKLQVVSIWDDPRDDAKNVDWTRSTYRDMFSSSGGVPAPGPHYEGTFVNYADTDLDDPALNTSGLSSFDLYYQGNLPRLRRVRARYDPKGAFGHAQSIPLP